MKILHYLKSLPLLFAMVFCPLLFLTMSGCSSIPNPVRSADTVEQKAFALYGTFIAFEEAGAVLIKDPDIPDSVKRDIVKADWRAKPLADSLLEAALELQKIRAQVRAGESKEDRLAIALANLTNWLATAKPSIDNLIDTVKRQKE